MSSSFSPQGSANTFSMISGVMRRRISRIGHLLQLRIALAYMRQDAPIQHALLLFLLDLREDAFAVDSLAQRVARPSLNTTFDASTRFKGTVPTSSTILFASCSLMGPPFQLLGAFHYELNRGLIRQSNQLHGLTLQLVRQLRATGGHDP